MTLIFGKFIDYLKRVASSEIDGDKGQPDDAGCVHGESDEFSLIEILWNLHQKRIRNEAVAF